MYKACRPRTFIALVAVSFFGLGTASAETNASNGTILGEREYEFPIYDDAYGYTRMDGTQDAIEKYWTRDEYERAINDQRFEFQKLEYASDGLIVVAYVYKPRTTTVALPTIVFNRGSAVHKDIAPVLVPYMHQLAQQGFVVIAPMYRQSDGGEGQDASGGDDIRDLLNIGPLIATLPYMDADNVFMSGESRGAMMVFQAIREGFPMRAAAVWGGFTDLQLMADAQPMLVSYAAANWPDFDAENMQAAIDRRSAIHWPESFNIPILLMHGESDRSVPVEHTYNLARELQRLGRLYGLIVFAEDNHILADSKAERDRATVAWFRRYDADADAEMMRHLETTALEAEINERGYSLLRRGRVADAVQVFQINVRRYSHSLNAYDSLGEALAISGDMAGAVQNYAKALQLADDDEERARLTNIIAALKK